MEIDRILRTQANWYRSKLLAEYPKYRELEEYQLLASILQAFEEAGIATRCTKDGVDHWRAKSVFMSLVRAEVGKTWRDRRRIKKPVWQI